MGLELVDPKSPEKGYMVVSGINKHIPEYEKKLGKMSLTDGVPIIREAPESLPEVPPDIAA